VSISINNTFRCMVAIALASTCSIAGVMVYTRFQLIVNMLPWMAHLNLLVLLIIPFAMYAVYHAIFKQMTHLLLKLSRKPLSFIKSDNKNLSINTIYVMEYLQKNKIKTCLWLATFMLGVFLASGYFFEWHSAWMMLFGSKALWLSYVSYFIVFLASIGSLCFICGKCMEMAEGIAKWASGQNGMLKKYRVCKRLNNKEFIKKYQKKTMALVYGMIALTIFVLFMSLGLIHVPVLLAKVSAILLLSMISIIAVMSLYLESRYYSHSAGDRKNQSWAQYMVLAVAKKLDWLIIFFVLNFHCLGETGITGSGANAMVSLLGAAGPVVMMIFTFAVEFGADSPDTLLAGHDHNCSLHEHAHHTHKKPSAWDTLREKAREHWFMFATGLAVSTVSFGEYLHFYGAITGSITFLGQTLVFAIPVCIAIADFIIEPSVLTSSIKKGVTLFGLGNTEDRQTCTSAEKYKTCFNKALTQLEAPSNPHTHPPLGLCVALASRVLRTPEILSRGYDIMGARARGISRFLSTKTSRTA
jgi:hypothetical protein